MAASRRSILPALGFIVLALAALLIYARLTGEDVRTSFATLDWRVVPVALGLHMLAHIFWAARYTVLAPPTGIRLPIHEAWALLTAGVFGGAISPGRIGGEALKLTLLVRRGEQAAPASRLLLLDRSIDLFFFLATGTVAIIVLPGLYGAAGGEAQWYAAIGTATLGVFVMLLVLAFWRPSALLATSNRLVAWWDRLRRRSPRDPRPRLRAFLNEVRVGIVASFAKHPGRIAVAFLLTAANWICEYAVLWMLLRGFGVELPYATVFLAGTVMTLVSNIPITPGGTGVAEFAAIALLGPLAGGITILFPVAWRSVTYLYDLAFGGTITAWQLSKPGRRPMPT